MTSEVDATMMPSVMTGSWSGDDEAAAESVASRATPDVMMPSIKTSPSGEVLPTVLAEALGLAEALDRLAPGRRVFPLKDRSKEPRFDRWQKKATCDPAKITDWFQSYPDANVGLRTGDGLFAVDIDSGKGGFETLDRLIEEHGGFPETAGAISGGGGRHLLFRVARKHRIINGVDWRPGIDIRGRDGYIVVEPSIHPETGREYVWTRHPKQGIAEAPAWLVAALPKQANAKKTRSKKAVSKNTPRRRDQPGRSGDEDRLLGQMIERFPIRGKGDRNDQMKRMVASLVGQGFGEDLVETVVLRWVEHFHGLGRMRAKLGEAVSHAVSTIRSAFKSTTLLRAGTDHLGECRAIKLTVEQSEKLRIGPPNKRPNRGPNTQYHKRVTKGDVPGLCRSSDEASFVEALLVLATRKLRAGEGPVMLTTNDQLREVADDRRPGVVWSNMQIARLKSKYIARLGPAGVGHRAAERKELLVEIKRGHRKPDEDVGQPSEFRLTGLYSLLTVEDQGRLDRMNSPATINFEGRPAEVALACTGASA